MIKKTCEYCGNSFMTTARIKYCSNDCRIRGRCETYKKTCQNKYGVDNTSKLQCNKNKHKQFMANNPPISPFNIQHWINKGYTEIQAQYQVDIRRPSNIKYWLHKGYTQESADAKMRQQHVTISKDSFIKRHGEQIGIRKYNETILKQKLNSKRCKQYYINKGYTQQQSIKMVSEYQRRDYNHFIKKYGQKLGIQKYNEKTKKWMKKIQFNMQSDQSFHDKFYTNRNRASLTQLKQVYPNQWKRYVITRFKPAYQPIIQKIFEYQSLQQLKNNIYNLVGDINRLNQILQYTYVKQHFNINDPMSIFIQILDKNNIDYRKRGKYGRYFYLNNILYKSTSQYNIAKFLLDNNISFEYERGYIGTKMKTDFYLIDKDTYIEYCGLMQKTKYVDKINIKKQYALQHKLHILFSQSQQEIFKFIRDLYENNNIENI